MVEVGLEHVDNVMKVGDGVLECTQRNSWNRGGGSTLVRLSPCPCADLENGLCREVCLILHTRVWLFVQVETGLKNRNDEFEWWAMVGVTVKPSDGTCKTDGRVNGFRVSDVSEDPEHTVHIVCVLFLKNFQVLYTHQ